MRGLCGLGMNRAHAILGISASDEMTAVNCNRFAEAPTAQLKKLSQSNREALAVAMMHESLTYRRVHSTAPPSVQQAGYLYGN